MNEYNASAPEDRVIGKVLVRQAEQISDMPFLLMDDQRLTFGEVNENVNSLTAGLRKMRIERGDRVALLMENSVEFILTALAINKLGAVWVPTNTSYRGEWLNDSLIDGDATLLIADAPLLERVVSLGADAPVRQAVVLGASEFDERPKFPCMLFEELGAGTAAEPDVDVNYRDVAAIMWTSGTTGRSKGVAHTHSSWLAPVKTFTMARDVRPGDVHYCCLPLFNAGGWVHNVFEALVEGVPIAIDREFSVSEFWNRIRYYGATQTITLGAMHMYLWQAEECDDDADNPLRVFGLIPRPADLDEGFRRRFGLEHTWSAYGQSETTACTMAGVHGDWQPNSSGVARADLEVRLLDDTDQEVSSGEVGEICVRPMVPDVIFSGYFNQPEATVRAYRNLWYHTGDLGRAEGREFFFVDRKADFMRHKGRNISSFEAEKAALAHPDVQEVAAHGVQALELDQESEVKLCVVRVNASSLTADKLARFINNNAPYYIVPRYIEFMDELPHTPTGRVQKFILRERGVTPDTWDRDEAGFVVAR